MIGYRGSGKTTVARLLAERLGRAWLDADALLEERHGRSVRALFALEGEAGFRDREAALLDELCGGSGRIIATGGGVVLRPANRERLRAAGRVIWLTADPRTLWQRLQDDATGAERRPVLTVGGLAEIEELLRVREPLYRGCAHGVIETANRSPADVAAAIAAWLQDPSSGPWPRLG